MNEALVRRGLRVIAIAIAAVAVVDPAVTSTRSVKPVVLVAALDTVRDASLADRVARTAGKQFSVVRSPIAGMSASVVVGDHLPNADDDYPAPTFAVLPDTTTPSVAIENIDAPAVARGDARVLVNARIAVHGASGRSLDVTLRAGASVADRVTRRLRGNDTTFTVPLSFVPAASAATTMQVTATLSGIASAAIANAVVDVRDRRWAVLFFDPRPSWTSTFVRRAIERDARFVVTSRVVTSRNVSADAGRPPATLDRAAVSAFDAIVIGAPEGLSPTDVAGLDAFMRRRGGSVVLLLDQRVPGAYDRLMSVATWNSRSTSSIALASSRPDSAALRATEIAYPSALPAGAIAIANAIAGGAQPVVWTSPIGAGRIIVSGALDAWRFRDPSASGFDRFWRAMIAEAASAAPPPLSVTLSTPIAAPGEMVDVRAAIRDAALEPALANTGDARTIRASIAATLDATVPIRMWPDGDVGQFSGTVRAPRAPGVSRITVTSDGATAGAPLIVAGDVGRPAPSDRRLLGAWTATRGGQTLAAAEIARLPAVLRAALRPPSRIETRHPMRSAWWIAPFVLALSGEWWFRRRRGLR